MRANRVWLIALVLVSAVLRCGPGFAQALVSEDFTGTSTNNPWYFFNGACLTASTAASTTAPGPGTPPGCTKDSYYTEALVGGYDGVAGSSATLPDSTGYGALRFTNGCISGSSCGTGGHSQNGAIISSNAYSTDQGLDITFKTVTYRGDSGGNGAGCPSGLTASGDNCSGTQNATATVTCPSGFTASGSSCVESGTVIVTYSCPSGYSPQTNVTSSTTCSESTKKNGKTTTTTTSPAASYGCSSGYTASGSGSNTTCTISSAPTSTTYSCPSGYTTSGSGSNETCSETAPAPDQNDGADGMSFFLVNGSVTIGAAVEPDGTSDSIGSFGGSLGYTCSENSGNPDYHGMYGAYLGLGIDEYGNFLNGSQNTLGVANANVSGDNTASGGGQWANRIGMRGEGSVDWSWLNSTYPTLYPNSWATTSSDVCLNTSGSTCTQYATEAEEAVKNTCSNGYLSDYNNNALSYNGTSPYSVPDYGAIPNAFEVLPASIQIANEYASGGYSRQSPPVSNSKYGTGANPITYDLKITADGLLSLSYSYNGGAWTSVIKNQSITASNGPLPSTVRFGFAGSTGGSSNIHEVLCFKADPASQAASSTTVNQQQSSKVETGSQAYFGYYNPQNWTGTLTANSLINTNGVLTIATTANWDGSCVLTGVASGTTCATTGQAGPATAQSWVTGSNGRVMLTYSGTAGIPFEWSSLSGTEQTALDAGDSSQTANRLQFLRGDAAEEIQNGGTYRNLDSVLADIIDSSSSWVGPPSMSIYSAYETPATWTDKLYSTDTMTENSGQAYSNYVTTESTRQNVVYVGANDGFVHGFSAGSFDTTGTIYNSTTNTGQELLAYMPAGVLNTIHNATNSSLDYANPQYGHLYSVDATPGTGDLYYGGAWHTWLVGGLGAGGSEIYALDITTPSNFSETNASSLVKGDWQGGTSAATNPGSFTCPNTANCALNLGNTYGTPTIRRLHDGDWGLIFGNGFNSETGDAGIFILDINPSSGAQTMYYLSAGKAGTSDGIAYAHPVDMDQDHVVDYVYAGDALGNVWRFDLTSNTASSWAVTSGPLFKTATGQAITSDVYPVFVQGTGGVQLMLFFGTGQKFPLTQTSAISYEAGQQSFYGIWDWNMSKWNSYNSTQFASMPAGTITTLGQTNLQQQTVTIDASTGDPSIETPYMVCWAGTTSCSAATVTANTSAVATNTQYGWYINFPDTNTGFGATTYEQVIYNPIEVTTAIQFNTILPAIDSPLECTPDVDQGWSYALNVANGNPVSGFFVNNGNTHTIALQTNASGSSSEVTTTYSNGSPANTYLIFQSTSGGAGTPTPIQPGNNISGNRQTWIQLR